MAATIVTAVAAVQVEQAAVAQAMAQDLDQELRGPPIQAAGAVVRMLEECGPRTDWEIRAAWHRYYEEKCCHHLYRQARSMARDAGRVRDSGARRPNPSTGRMQIVWETEDSTFILEQRTTSLEELFQRGAL